MRLRDIAVVAAAVALVLFVFWLLTGVPPRCDSGKIPVMGEGKWYCVEGTEMPTRG